MLIFAALALQGCAERKPHVHPWATTFAVRPHIPVPAPGYKPEQPETDAPDLPWDFPPPPSRLAVVRLPARPHTAAPPSPPESPGNAKTATPSLAPQLSEQEIAAAQQQMNESLAVVQRNLDAAHKHRLNAAQTDLASKINTFLEDSKGAAREGDWTRAKNLAKKAQILSEELAESF